MVERHEIAVLGGGLSGLAASIAAKAPVFEAEEKAGGVARSDRSEGFTFDRGIHVLQTSNQEILDFLSELGVQFRSHSRNAFIYSNQRYTPYPFQVNTSQMPLGLRARCLWQYLTRDQSLKPRNYEEWMYSTLGKGFADHFLIPYSEKFWTVPPREMTHDWTNKRVPQPTLQQVLRGAFWSKQTEIGTNSTFRYPIGEAAYGEVALALEKRAEVRPNQRAVHVDPARRKIQFASGLNLQYGTLISTIPLPDLLAITPDAPRNVQDAAAHLRTNSILVVNLGIGRPHISDKHWVHFPEKDVSFFRISYPHNFGPEVAPPQTSSVSAEVAYSSIHGMETEHAMERVIQDLIRVGAIRQDDPIIFKSSFRIHHAYCIYDMKRTEALRTIHAWMREFGIIPAGRYGLWTYFWSDESILSGRKAGRNALERTPIRGDSHNAAS